MWEDGCRPTLPPRLVERGWNRTHRLPGLNCPPLFRKWVTLYCTTHADIMSFWPSTPTSWARKRDRLPAYLFGNDSKHPRMPKRLKRIRPTSGARKTGSMALPTRRTVVGTQFCARYRMYVPNFLPIQTPRSSRAKKGLMVKPSKRFSSRNQRDRRMPEKEKSPNSGFR